ncbi:MAG: outer membrane protein assembly factor BamB [Gammaproteobacteria bacterium]|nr:outer membrane protein assembly factor BamB [Gammaproteobacteria bacterium]
MKKYLQLILVSALLATLNACSYFFDTDNTPTPATLQNFTAAHHPKMLWRTSTGNGSGNEETKLFPAIANNRVFTASTNGIISAVDQHTGKILWQNNIDEPISSGVAVNDSLVFAGTRSGQFFAIRQSDGVKVWQTRVSSETLAPAVATRMTVLVKSIDGNVTALATSTGRVLWHYREKEPDLILRGGSAPRILGNTAYAGFENGVLVALNLKTGRPLWQATIADPEGIFAIQRMVDIDANPVAHNNRIFVATWQGNIAALNAIHGQKYWSHHASTASGITVDNENVYLADADSHVSAFDVMSGHKRWEQDQLTARTLSGPALMENTIIVGDAEGWLHWINKNTGEFVARTEVGSSILATPLVSEQVAYVYTKDGQLSAWVLDTSRI